MSLILKLFSARSSCLVSIRKICIHTTKFRRDWSTERTTEESNCCENEVESSGETQSSIHNALSGRSILMGSLLGILSTSTTE